MKRLSLYWAFAVLFFSLMSFLILKPSLTRESAIPLMRSIGFVFKQMERLSSHLFPLSAEEERAIGNRIYKRYSFGAISQSPYQDLLVPLRAKLMEPSPLVTRYPNNYAFVVISSYPVVNAFALPGGLISIFDGLMKKFSVETPGAKPALANPDALAFVMAHEMGHVELLHAADSVRYKALLYGPDAGYGGVTDLLRGLAHLSYGEVEELEADAFALRLMNEKGYRLAGAVEALQTISNKENREGLHADPGEFAKDVLLDYFRTHPMSKERLDHLNRAIRKLNS